MYRANGVIIIPVRFDVLYVGVVMVVVVNLVSVSFGVWGGKVRMRIWTLHEPFVEPLSLLQALVHPSYDTHPDLVEPQRQAGTTQNIYYQLIITNLTVVPLTNELNIILINNK